MFQQAPIILFHQIPGIVCSMWKCIFIEKNNFMTHRCNMQATTILLDHIIVSTPILKYIKFSSPGIIRCKNDFFHKTFRPFQIRQMAFKRKKWFPGFNCFLDFFESRSSCPTSKSPALANSFHKHQKLFSSKGTTKLIVLCRLKIRYF